MSYYNRFVSGEMAIRCSTKEEYETFLKLCDYGNLHWANGKNPLTERTEEREGEIRNPKGIRRFRAGRNNYYYIVNGNLHLGTLDRINSIGIYGYRAINNFPSPLDVDENGFEKENFNV